MFETNPHPVALTRRIVSTLREPDANAFRLITDEPYSLVLLLREPICTGSKP